MDELEHSFDWRGFSFASKLFGGMIAVVLLGNASITFALAQIQVEPPSPQLAVIVSTTTQPAAVAVAYGTSTPERVINSLTIRDVIPPEGKFVAADLVAMKIYLYENGTTTAEYPILTKGKPGTPWETPGGFYSIQTKEWEHFSTIGKVYMPYSMQFYGNYFTHGQTFYPGGALTSASFSGGCIKLATEDAKKVYTFAALDTRLFVYDAKNAETLPPLKLAGAEAPSLEAGAYLVADIDTGDVYLERNAREVRPIASVTKLMTALVANEVISFDKHISVPQGVLVNPPNPEAKSRKQFAVGDLMYPLLMQSSNGVAEAIAHYYGKEKFMGWMNTTAKALAMASTTYADASGISPGNTSTPDDLFRLTAYLANKKSFVFDITRITRKNITADDNSKFEITNVNAPAYTEPFAGGKAGHTTAAKDTMVSLLSFRIGDTLRRVAVIILGSENQEQDSERLAAWVTDAATLFPQTACVGCSRLTTHRKIDL